MIKKLLLWFLLCNLAFAQTNLGPIKTTTQDSKGFAASPPFPDNGYCRSYFNTTTGSMEYIDHTGAACNTAATGITGAPASSQTVIQPADGSGNPTSLNDNVFNSVTYAAQSFNWARSPTGALTASTPNTVTLSPMPLGISNLNHTLYIDTVGTPEVIQITSFTGLAGATSGTITFTPANAHLAGYRIRSATGGLKEASEWAKLDLTSPTAASAYGVVIVPPQDGIEMRGTFFMQASHQSIHLEGGYLRCYVAPCVFAGKSTATSFQDMTITGLACQPQADFTTTVGTDGATCLEDNAQNTRIYRPQPRDPAITFPTTNYSAFYSYLQIDDDEGAIIRDIYISSGSSHFGRCDTTVCSFVIYTKGGSNFAVLTVDHANFTCANLCNGIDNQGANTMNLMNSVIQSTAQISIRTKGGSLNVAGSVYGWYGEAGGGSNPNGTGSAGLVCQSSGGYCVLRGSIYTGILPSYAASVIGATDFDYYIRAISSTLGTGAWQPAGHCLSNGTGTCTVKWPPIGTTGTITYEAARCQGGFGTGCNTSLYTAIMVGGSASATGTVATGLAQGTVCTGTASNGSCVLVDDVTASTSSGTALTLPTYCPAMPFWPGRVVISPTADAACTNTPVRLFVDDIDNVTNSPIIAAIGAGVPTIDAQHVSSISGSPGGGGGPVWVQSLHMSSAQGLNMIGGTVLQNGAFNGSNQDVTGRLGVINPAGGGASVRGCIWQLQYANKDALLATPGLRMSLDATDSCLGIAVGGTPTNTVAGLATGAGFQIYVNHLMDGTNYIEAVSATAKTFKVPVQITPTVFASLPTCNAGAAGTMRMITDSSTLTYAATVTGGGVNIILALCNGTNWTAH